MRDVRTNQNRANLDRIIVEFDRALRTLSGVRRPLRNMPGEQLEEADLPEVQRRHVAALMRVNHTGEICAQALYSGQLLTAHSEGTRQALEHAGDEEAEHLAWTASRVESLGGRLSVLNPVFYAGAFAIGAASGLLGDRWSMGFLAETEKQVEAHLDGHLERLPSADQKSRAVVERMKDDEMRHAASAAAQGATELPAPVKCMMKLMARVMTITTYRI